MRATRQLRDSSRNPIHRRTLLAEPLEKKELLAADFSCAAVPVAPPATGGECIAECQVLDSDDGGAQAEGPGTMLQSAARRRGSDGGPRGANPAGPVQAGSTTVDGELSDSEVLDIKYLREEEKLARDVYLALGEIWDVPVFTKIAQAESRHMAAVEQLIDRYGLEDPVGDHDRGEFEDETLAGLYQQLVGAGSVSLLDAYKVGAKIEEMDIADLQQALLETERADMERLYESLERGSRNHLRAFDAQIEATGETYQAEFLSQAEYEAIAASAREQGNGQSPQSQGRSANAHVRIGEMRAVSHRHGGMNGGQNGLRENRSHGECDTTQVRDKNQARDRNNSPGTGNVRELRNAIQRACLMCRGDIIMPEHLPPKIGRHASNENPASPDAGRLSQVEQATILATLEECKGNRTHAAKKLGISRRALIYKLRAWSPKTGFNR